MQQKGECILPNLLVFNGYKLYFWAIENNEPIHVHVAVGRPTQSSTKFWLTQDRGCFVASNESRIPKKTLNELSNLIEANYDYICQRWSDFFGEEPRFYC